MLLCKIEGKLVLIWDGSPIHCAYEIKDASLAGSGERPNAFVFGTTAQLCPDLNPDEGIWNYLKRVELGNVCCSDLDQLYRKLIQAKERLLHKMEIIKSCSRKSRLLGLVS